MVHLTKQAAALLMASVAAVAAATQENVRSLSTGATIATIPASPGVHVGDASVPTALQQEFHGQTHKWVQQVGLCTYLTPPLVTPPLVVKLQTRRVPHASTRSLALAANNFAERLALDIFSPNKWVWKFRWGTVFCHC
jgi:hypothetical protein